jgi:hypothetical protein
LQLFPRTFIAVNVGLPIVPQILHLDFHGVVELTYGCKGFLLLLKNIFVASFPVYFPLPGVAFLQVEQFL